MSPSSGKLRVFELCSGTNALGLGAEQAGFEVVGTAEVAKDARLLSFLNTGRHPLGDIRKLKGTDFPEAEVAGAGSSCKGFSHVGKRQGFAHPEGDLILHCIRIASERGVKAIVTENVEGLTNHENGKTLEVINETLIRHGYTPFAGRILRASDFACATTRPRWFAVSFQAGLNLAPLEWPTPKSPPVNLRSVLLPDHLVENLYINGSTFVQEGPKKLRTDPYAALRVGYLAKDYPDRRVYSIDAPAPTFLAGMGGPGGPSRMYLMDNGRVRRLASKEMLAAMGYPSGFRMPFDSFRAGKLIGNAICPPVAKAVMAMTYKAITGMEPPQ